MSQHNLGFRPPSFLVENCSFGKKNKSQVLLESSCFWVGMTLNDTKIHKYRFYSVLVGKERMDGCVDRQTRVKNSNLLFYLWTLKTTGTEH